MKIEIEVTARRLQDEPAVIRRLIIHFGLVLALGTAATDEVAAQQVSRVPRIGLLLQTSPGQTRAADEFREDMRSLGWSDGSTVSIEDRFANGDPTRLSANAAEFVASKVDVIVAFGPLPTQAARHASSTIPIVGATVDPGLVQSLSRPGGNVTGVTLMMPDITAKQLQLLKEVVPQTRKVGILSQNNNPLQTQLMTEIERGAATLGISVLPVRVGTAQDLPPCFDKMKASAADAYFVLADPITVGMRADIATLALHHHLPGLAQLRSFGEAGVLLSYGASLPALQRRAAFFVDKILRGASPGDLPVEQPTTFELVINLKTARALGLTVPQSILARADEVIE